MHPITPKTLTKRSNRFYANIRLSILIDWKIKRETKGNNLRINYLCNIYLEKVSWNEKTKKRIILTFEVTNRKFDWDTSFYIFITDTITWKLFPLHLNTLFNTWNASNPHIISNIDIMELLNYILIIQIFTQKPMDKYDILWHISNRFYTMPASQ